MTDESPDTEEQLTSQDFIKEGPIERGIAIQSLEEVEAESPFNRFDVLKPTDPEERAHLFKAMAFEADKEAKRLQARIAFLEDAFDKQVALMNDAKRDAGIARAALLDIEGRVATWRESNWLEVQSGTAMSSTMLAILAVVRRVK